jgi:DNA-binding beta-propeller fold protein YncE
MGNRFLMMLVAAITLAGAQARAGLLLVSGFDSKNVVAFDATSGAFSRVFVKAGSGGLSGSEQLAFAPNNDLLVASFGSNEVLRYDGKSGDFHGVFAAITRPVGIVVHDGFAYVSSYDYSGGVVNRYNAMTGAFVDTFVAKGSGGLGPAHGLAFGPDGNLYVADNLRDRVLRFDGTTGAFVGAIDSGHPTGLTFGPDGNLYVSDGDHGRVLKHDGATGAFLGNFIATGYGGLVDPHGLVFRDDGKLYVSGGDGVRRYDSSTGAFIDLFASADRLRRPTYMTFAPVPEPATYVTLLAGLAVLILVWRRRP